MRTWIRLAPSLVFVGSHRRVFALAGILVFLGMGLAQAAVAAPALVVPAQGVPVLVTVPLGESQKLEPAGPWQLSEAAGHEGLAVQLVRAIAADGTEGRENGRLVAALPAGQGNCAERRFCLQRASAGAVEGPAFQFKDVDDKSLGLWEGDKPVLVYNHGVITKENLPQNESRRSRSCYVHPVWGLNGEIVTDDFPRDHYHHHGIFWTWPHVSIEGQQYDLWADKGIRQKFVRWLDRETGPLAAVLAVENGWFVGDRKVMIERVWLQAYKSDGNTRALDIELVFIPTDRPITLWGAEGKSYGGLTMRFAPRSRQDTLITVPSGRTKDDLPDTPLAWADFTSKFGEAAAQSGGAVLVDPNHPNYPPTWLTRHYGPLCVGWPGVKPQTFEPRRPIRLSYRVWLHKTVVEPAEIQKVYDAYGAARKAKWESM
jgi:hypothetical protein